MQAAARNYGTQLPLVGWDYKLRKTGSLSQLQRQKGSKGSLGVPGTLIQSVPMPTLDGVEPRPSTADPGANEPMSPSSTAPDTSASPGNIIPVVPFH